MTKLMFCGDCGDIVPPGQDMEVRWCRCKRHACWWLNGKAGLFRVHDSMFPTRSGQDGGMAWVIGLHNGLLTYRGTVAFHYPAEHYNLITTKKAVEEILENTPDTYIFKRAHSLVIRIAPGASNDTGWSDFPKAP